MEEINYLSELFHYRSMKKINTYLKNVKDNFYRLSKSKQKEYIEAIKMMGYASFMDEIFEPDYGYQVFSTKQSVERLILHHYFAINKDNFAILMIH